MEELIPYDIVQPVQQLALHMVEGMLQSLQLLNRALHGIMNTVMTSQLSIEYLCGIDREVSIVACTRCHASCLTCQSKALVGCMCALLSPYVWLCLNMCATVMKYAIASTICSIGLALCLHGCNLDVAAST